MHSSENPEEKSPVFPAGPGRQNRERPATTILDTGAVANLNPFGGKLRAVVIQTPGGHVLGRAVLHADDDVAVPRPRVISVILPRPRRMVGMRLIPADHFESLVACRLFRRENVFRGHRKTVAR